MLKQARTCEAGRLDALPVELRMPRQPRCMARGRDARAAGRTGGDAKSNVPVNRPGPGGLDLSPNTSRPATSGA